MNHSLVIRFLISRTCSALGDQLLMFAVPLIVYRATQSVAMAGMAMFIEWLPRVISLPIAGALSDRVGGWRIYSLADTVRAIACAAALSGALLAPEKTFALVAALMAFCAFFYAQAFIALEATVPLLVETRDMPKTQGVLQGIDQTAMIGGPAAAAVALIWIQPMYLLGIAAVLFMVSAVFVWSLRSALVNASQTVRQIQHRHFVSDLRGGIDVLREQPFLFALIGLSMMVNLIVGLSLASGAALTVGKFAQPDTHFAALQIGVGILSLISFAAVPRLMKRFSLFSLGIGAYYIITVGGLLMASADRFPLFVIGFALSCGLCGLFNIYIRTERVQWIPRQHMGKTISLIVLLNQLSLPLSGLLVSTQSDATGVQHLFMYVAGGAVLASLFLLPALQRNSRTLGLQPQDAGKKYNQAVLTANMRSKQEMLAYLEALSASITTKTTEEQRDIVQGLIREAVSNEIIALNKALKEAAQHNKRPFSQRLVENSIVSILAATLGSVMTIALIKLLGISLFN